MLPAVASSGVALVVAGYLASHLGPRYDEFHTLSHLDDADPGALWRSYREARDTLPPTGYVLHWVWAKAVGSSLIATRIPSVLSWAAAAGSLSLITRRAGRWPSFVAGLFPTMTALGYLGFFARPYAAAFAALAGGVLAWQRSAEVCCRRRWLTIAFAAFSLASSLHYLTASVPLCLAVATAWPIARGERPRADARFVVPAAAAILPLIVSAPLFADAAADQGRLDRSVSPLDAPAFWPSTARPALPAIVTGIAVVIAVIARSRSAGGHPRSTWSQLDADTVRSAALMIVVVPVVSVLAMLATSGVYVHRYAVGALIGASILAAWALTWVLGFEHRSGPAFGVLALIGVALATTGIAGSMIDLSTSQSLSEELALGGSGDGPIVVLDEYDFLLLKMYGDDAVAQRILLGAPATVATSPTPVTMSEVLADDSPGRQIEVVGDTEHLLLFLDGNPGWTAVLQAETTYVRPGTDRVLGAYLLVPPPSG